MKRLIGILIILLVLVGLSVGEEILVNKTTSTLHHTSYHMERLIKENEENINCKEVRDEFDDLNTFWDRTEQLLCYIVNFEKIKPINETLHKLDGAISENDFSVAIENVETLQNYSENLKYIMGASLTNFL